jgi:hypothetical protein
MFMNFVVQISVDSHVHAISFPDVTYRHVIIGSYHMSLSTQNNPQKMFKNKLLRINIKLTKWYISNILERKFFWLSSSDVS